MNLQLRNVINTCGQSKAKHKIRKAPTLSTVISLCNTISEQGLEGKHPMNSVSNTKRASGPTPVYEYFSEFEILKFDAAFGPTRN